MIPPVKKPPKKEMAHITIRITATVHKMFDMILNLKVEKTILFNDLYLYMYKICCQKNQVVNKLTKLTAERLLRFFCKKRGISYSQLNANASILPQCLWEMLSINLN